MKIETFTPVWQKFEYLFMVVLPVKPIKVVHPCILQSEGAKSGRFFVWFDVCALECQCKNLIVPLFKITVAPWFCWEIWCFLWKTSLFVGIGRDAEVTLSFDWFYGSRREHLWYPARRKFRVYVISCTRMPVKSPLVPLSNIYSECSPLFGLRPSGHRSLLSAMNFALVYSLSLQRSDNVKHYIESLLKK